MFTVLGCRLSRPPFTSYSTKQKGVSDLLSKKKNRAIVIEATVLLALLIYCKISKISPGPVIFFKGPFWGAYFWRDLYSEGLIYGGKLRFKIDWASLIVGRKFTVFPLFYFVFEGNFQVQPLGGGLYLEGLIFGILRWFIV